MDEKTKKTIVFGILPKQYADKLQVPTWIVGDDLMFPQALLSYYLSEEHDSTMPSELRIVFEKLGFEISKIKNDVVVVYREETETFVFIGYLIKAAQDKEIIVNGEMKTEDGLIINYSLQPVDDQLMDKLPENRRKALINALEERRKENNAFQMPVFKKMRIVMDKK